MFWNRHKWGQWSEPGDITNITTKQVIGYFQKRQCQGCKKVEHRTRFFMDAR